MHSEHILKERSDAQNVVSRFPCGDTILLHNLRRQPRPFSLKSAPEGRHHHPLNPLNLLNLLNPLNPHAAGVSKGGAAVAPRAKRYTTRRRQAATTLGPKARQPSHRRCVPGSSSLCPFSLL